MFDVWLTCFAPSLTENGEAHAMIYKRIAEYWTRKTSLRRCRARGCTDSDILGKPKGKDPDV